MPKTSNKSSFQRIHERKLAAVSVTHPVDISAISRRARVEFDREENNLTIVWPDASQKGGIARVNASALLAYPSLYEPFADALVRSGKKKGWRTSTLTRNVDAISRSFYAFLTTERLANFSIRDFSTTFVNSYIRWLDRTVDNESVLAVSTRELEMSCFRALIDGLRGTRWGHQLPADLEVRANVWSGQSAITTEKTRTIPHDEFRNLYQACVREIAQISDDVRNMRKRMAEASIHPIVFANSRGERESLAEEWFGTKFGKICNPYKDLGLALATLKYRYPSTLVSLEMLLQNKSDSSLPKAISRYHGGWARFSRCFYPTTRDLMPFLIMLGLHLPYNLETLLACNVDDFEIRENELGRREVVASAEPRSFEPDYPSKDSGRILISAPRKGRSQGARQPQVRPVTDSIDNPASILNFLIEWTSEIRKYAEIHFDRRLFLFVRIGLREGGLPQGFQGYGGQCCTDSSFDHAYQSFFKDNQLPYHSFRSFRATGLDITDIIFGGDIRAKQAAGNHTAPDVTHKKYTTAGQMERGDEVLAEVRLLQERWRKSNMRIDPRGKPEHIDLGAATPGWACLDPFDSPFDSKGTLCTSLGQCPRCPQGFIDITSAYACAQAWSLLHAIDQAAGEIAPDAWRLRWLPVKERLLNYWLPQFEESVTTQVRASRLPLLPPLE